MSETAQETFNNTVQIVLIGATGSGKSSTGNTILGERLFKSEASARSVTQECETATEIINGWQVKVLDTPGWDCTTLTEHEVMSQIKQALQCLDGPYSFLLVIRVGSMESEKEINNIFTLKSELGPSFLDHTTILFSRSDDLEGQTFEDFIKKGGKVFQDLLKRCGERYHCWNNRDSRPDKTVEELLKDLKKTEMINPKSGKTSQNKMNNEEENPSASSCHGEQQENAATNRKQGAVGLETDMCTSRPDKTVEELLKDLKNTEIVNPNSGKTSQDKMKNKEEQPSASSGHGEQQENAVTNRKRGAVSLETDMCTNRPDKTVEEVQKHLKNTEIINPSSQDNKEENHSASSWYAYQEKHAVANKKRSKDTDGLETDMSENLINVLFIGRQKEGKTSSIRTLTEKCVENKSGADVVYTHPSTGLSLNVVESPGFDDNKEQIQKTISNSLSNCSLGPHVIIIVLSLDRFTPATKTAMKHVQDCLGQNARKHTMILFTKKDKLEGRSIKDFIQGNQHLKGLVNIHENRYHALNNRDTSNKTQGDELLKKIKTIYEQNNKEIYTKKQEDFDHNKGMPSDLSFKDIDEKAPQCILL